MHLTGRLQLLAAGFLALACNVTRAEIPQDQLQFFEAKIRPVLIDSCYKCHSAEAENIKGGLALDTKAGLLSGGDSGPSLVPGNLDASLLWTAVSYEDEYYEMPPKQKLPDDVVEDFRKWILMGAPDPRDEEAVTVRTEINIEEGKKVWSFQPPAKVDPPTVSNEAWPKSDIDRFILAKLDEAKMESAADASAGMILRRLYFDLIGLPPSPEQARDFYLKWREDPQEAVGATVQQLLDSPQFGERWGRHWLDIARYAESSGKESNRTFPHAWRYRDYVIDSFNEDKPFDEFVREQIAGDLVSDENLIATGFLALGPKSLTERNPRQFRMDLVDEQIDTMTQSILGLTVACARCHDHKSDPIPQSDYYALAGIFLSTETFYGTTGLLNPRKTDLLALSGSGGAGNELKAELAAKKQERDDLIRLAADARQNNERPVPGNGLRILKLAGEVAALQRKVNDSPAAAEGDFCMGVQDSGYPVNATLLVRGEVDKPAQQVPRGFVQVLNSSAARTIPSGKSGRLELADWMTSSQNPLTARVFVNRVWQHLFGQGLVATPDNFGASGQSPTHPELLDHLALSFMENGWSVK
ncbi:MAG: PSD1 and planctomycete cytochrome C domain-containing protein, partial [Verrucomicrobiota bacterium]